MATREENRTDNLQWAGAEDYHFEPTIYGKDLAGNDDFYLNLILGIAVKYFGAETLKHLYAQWAGHLRRETYDLIALYLLEDLVYHRALTERPVLESLREDYATRFLDDRNDLRRRTLALRVNLFYTLQMKRTHDILHRPYGKLNAREKTIYDHFYLKDDTDAIHLEEQILTLFKDYLHYGEKNYLRPKWLPDFNLFAIPGYVSIERSNAPSLFKDGEGTSSGITPTLHLLKWWKKDHRPYIEETFGRNLFPQKKSDTLDHSICTDGHAKSHIYFTLGIDEGDTRLNQSLNDRTVRRHLLKFEKNKSAYTHAIADLSRAFRLKLASVTTLEAEPAKRGKLVSRKAFRSKISDRATIFEKRILSPAPSFKVDLILDASTSLLDMESDIAIEAYILSKSLENNGIQSRVLSYQTVEDFTVVTILKDYDEKSDMKRIFRYKSMGWNRDGLFFKAYPTIIDTKDRLLSVILTDAKPSDFRPLTKSGIRLNTPYADEAAIDDTAHYLRQLRRKNMTILALLNSDYVDNAKKLYGAQFVKIHKIEQIAHVAGKFIQKELVKMER